MTIIYVYHLLPENMDSVVYAKIFSSSAWNFASAFASSLEKLQCKLEENIGDTSSLSLTAERSTFYSWRKERIHLSQASSKVLIS